MFDSINILPQLQLQPNAYLFRSSTVIYHHNNVGMSAFKSIANTSFRPSTTGRLAVATITTGTRSDNGGNDNRDTQTTTQQSWKQSFSIINNVNTSSIYIFVTMTRPSLQVQSERDPTKAIATRRQQHTFATNKSVRTMERGEACDVGNDLDSGHSVDNDLD